MALILIAQLALLVWNNLSLLHARVHVRGSTRDQRLDDQISGIRESTLFSTPNVGYPTCSDKWRLDK